MSVSRSCQPVDRHPQLGQLGRPLVRSLQPEIGRGGGVRHGCPLRRQIDLLTLILRTLGVFTAVARPTPEMGTVGHLESTLRGLRQSEEATGGLEQLGHGVVRDAMTDQMEDTDLVGRLSQLFPEAVRPVVGVPQVEDRDRAH
ncbi:hypothetical protein AADG42_17285 [Ammonicoccus fulvus]|uniref:DUF2267 domain-containing protein n=1 Tax=Ammonicoccus fulvus TaxID=3138240 RepID=A0ABZ3FW55_9ACTN